MSLDDLLVVTAFIIASIALDGVFFWRLKNIHDAFFKAPDELNYVYFIFPRIIFVAISGLVVSLGSLERPINIILIIFGGTIFGMSSIYPHIVIFLRSERL